MSTPEYILITQFLSTFFLMVAMLLLFAILIVRGKIVWYIVYKKSPKGGWSPSIVSEDFLKRNSFKREQQSCPQYKIDEKDNGKTIAELVELYPPPPPAPEDQ